VLHLASTSTKTMLAMSCAVVAGEGEEALKRSWRFGRDERTAQNRGGLYDPGTRVSSA
jgi:hypothetical protein